MWGVGVEGLLLELLRGDRVQDHPGCFYVEDRGRLGIDCRLEGLGFRV